MQDKVMHVPSFWINVISKLMVTEALGTISNYKSWNAQSIQDEVVMCALPL
jgi:hypothetical protein